MLLDQLPMIPRLTASPGMEDVLSHDYADYELLEVDDTTGEILIGKPCAAAWAYTKSKHLLILCGEVAAVWQHNTVLQVYHISESTVNEYITALTVGNLPEMNAAHM